MKTAIIALLIIFTFTIEAILTVITLTIYAMAIAAANDGFVTSDLIKKL